MQHPRPRCADITSFIVMDVLERAQAMERDGIDVIHMEVGEPDFDTPPVVREAMVEALASGGTHYTHSLGIWPLREAIAERYATHYGVEVSPERVVVTAGTSGAFCLVFGALFDIGDGMILADPGYPCYPNFCRYLGIEPHLVPVFEEEGYRFAPEAIEEAVGTHGAKGVVVSSPANPTGVITPREAYEDIAGRVEVLISDEIYHGLNFSGARDMTALEVRPDAVIIDGFSKRYAMTGLRVGWTVIPQELVRTVNKLSQNLFICASSVAQHGALAAILHAQPDVDEMVATYAKRQRYLLDALVGLGLVVRHRPQGAFYVFADISRYSQDSYAFCMQLLEEAHVAITPGVDFGTTRTDRYVRFSVANSMEAIEEGMRRMGRFLERQPRLDRA